MLRFKDRLVQLLTVKGRRAHAKAEAKVRLHSRTDLLPESRRVASLSVQQLLRQWKGGRGGVVLG